MNATTDANDPDAARRRELGQFLRSAREAIAPQTIGLAASGRRRAKGLLREEVASAAGISATWYMWLEQARPVRPSPRALDGLSRALRLDAVQRAYLYRLARPDLQPGTSQSASYTPSAALLQLLEALAPKPAYLLDQRWDVVAWNAPAERLLGSFPGDEWWSRNLVARMFIDPQWRALFADWHDVARSCVAQFRAMAAELGRDPDHARLVSALEQASPEFAALWAMRELAEAPGWTKRFSHPELGALAFTYTSLRPEGADRQFRLTIYTAADDSTRQAWCANTRPPATSD